jgi:hypothetical protein
VRVSTFASTKFWQFTESHLVRVFSENVATAGETFRKGFCNTTETNMLHIIVGIVKPLRYLGSCCHRTVWYGPATVCRTALFVTVQEHSVAYYFILLLLLLPISWCTILYYIIVYYITSLTRVKSHTSPLVYLQSLESIASQNMLYGSQM